MGQAYDIYSIAKRLVCGIIILARGALQISVFEIVAIYVFIACQLTAYNSDRQ